MVANYTVAFTTTSIMSEPYPNDSKKLIGYDFYRVDVGEYRVIYAVHHDELHIVLIGKRNDDQVYKALKHKN